MTLFASITLSKSDFIANLSLKYPIEIKSKEKHIFKSTPTTSGIAAADMFLVLHTCSGANMVYSLDSHRSVSISLPFLFAFTLRILRSLACIDSNSNLVPWVSLSTRYYCLPLALYSIKFIGGYNASRVVCIRQFVYWDGRVMMTLTHTHTTSYDFIDTQQ